MRAKTFRILLFCLTGLGLLLTVAHFACAVYAYRHASVIQFVARELW